MTSRCGKVTLELTSTRQSSVPATNSSNLRIDYITSTEVVVSLQTTISVIMIEMTENRGVWI